MNNTPDLPIESLSLTQAKTLAKRLRLQLEKDGKTISHSNSLEMLAAQYGFRDWNTMFAYFGNQTKTNQLPITIGQHVTGQYLGHDFTAEVLGVQAQHGGSRYKVTIKLDQAVDVVRFDSFSAFRKRINATINKTGETTEKTSDGVPILKLNI